MNKLDLNAYGVTEMNSNEMENVDGGGLGGILAAIICIAGVITGNPIAVAVGAFWGGLDATDGFGSGRGE